MIHRLCSHLCADPTATLYLAVIIRAHGEGSGSEHSPQRKAWVTSLNGNLTACPGPDRSLGA